MIISNNPAQRLGYELQRNKEAVLSQVLIWCEHFLHLAVFFLFTILWLSGLVPQPVPFAAASLVQLLRIVKQMTTLSKTQALGSKKFFIKELLLSFFSFLFIFYLMFISYVPEAQLVISLCPLLANMMVFLLFKVKNYHRINYFSSKLEICIQLVAFMAVLFAGLKDIQVIQMDWIFVFWSVWIEILVFLVFGALQLAKGFKKIFYRRNREDFNEAVGRIWIGAALICAGFCGFYLFFCLSRELDMDKWNGVKVAILVFLLYFVVLAIFTWILRNLLT
jgi:hypothetical protein